MIKPNSWQQRNISYRQLLPNRINFTDKSLKQTVSHNIKHIQQTCLIVVHAAFGGLVNV